MSNFDEKVVDRIKRLEREVERLRVKESPIMSNYLLTTGKAADADKLDGNHASAFATAGHNHDTAYLGITAKAADSDKLDGIDSTGFVQTSGNQTVEGVKTFSSIPVLPSTNPTTANQAVRKAYVDALGTWTSYVPTFDGWTDTPNNICHYTLIGKLCIVRINITSGTSDPTDGDIATATLPFTSRTVANHTWDGVCGKCADNSSILTTPCRWEVTSNSNIVSFYKDMGVGTWTKSGTKVQKAIIIYEIA